jgi:hypothetical protein
VQPYRANPRLLLLHALKARFFASVAVCRWACAWRGRDGSQVRLAGTAVRYGYQVRLRFPPALIEWWIEGVSAAQPRTSAPVSSHTRTFLAHTRAPSEPTPHIRARILASHTRTFLAHTRAHSKPTPPRTLEFSQAPSFSPHSHYLELSKRLNAHYGPKPLTRTFHALSTHFPRLFPRTFQTLSPPIPNPSGYPPSYPRTFLTRPPTPELSPPIPKPFPYPILSPLSKLFFKLFLKLFLAFSLAFSRPYFNFLKKLYNFHGKHTQRLIDFSFEPPPPPPFF